MPEYEPLLTFSCSAAGMAERTFDCEAASCALLLKLRYAGTAMAMRMPRITMTTRSSMRVKPSSEPSRFLMRSNIVLVLLPHAELDGDFLTHRRCQAGRTPPNE